MDQCPICQELSVKSGFCYNCDWNDSRIICICKQCGQKFSAQPNQVNNPRYKGGSFCSRACKHEWQRGRLSTRARPDEKLLHSAGYVLAWAPDHPRASKGRVFEHILVAEQMVGRSLLPGETVHHKDKNRQNNDPSNLEILTNSDHVSLHSKDQPTRRVALTCPACGNEFWVKPYQANPENPERRIYCSRKCGYTMLSGAVKERHRRQGHKLT